MIKATYLSCHNLIQNPFPNSWSTTLAEQGYTSRFVRFQGMLSTAVIYKTRKFFYFHLFCLYIYSNFYFQISTLVLGIWCSLNGIISILIFVCVAVNTNKEVNKEVWCLQHGLNIQLVGWRLTFLVKLIHHSLLWWIL